MRYSTDYEFVSVMGHKKMTSDTSPLHSGKYFRPRRPGCSAIPYFVRIENDAQYFTSVAEIRVQDL